MPCAYVRGFDFVERQRLSMSTSITRSCSCGFRRSKPASFVRPMSAFLAYVGDYDGFRILPQNAMSELVTC